MFDELRRLAAAQHGIVSRSQCRGMGLDAARLRSALRRGELQRVAPGVLRVTGAPLTARATVMAAVLDAGDEAVASHDTAAALWGFPGFRLTPPQAARPRGRERFRPTIGRIHEPRLLPRHHCTVVDAIPVTTPARTIFDLAGTSSPARVERALDSAVAASPKLLRVLHGMLPVLAERGRTGITLMRELLDARPAGSIAPASGLEARVIRLLDEAGVPTRRQVDLGGDDWIGRVDLLVTGTNLVIEVDSVRYHSSVSDRRRDAERDAALQALGYQVLRVTEEEVWAAPYEVTRRIRAAIRTAA